MDGLPDEAIELRFLIHRDNAGKIVGENSSNVNRLFNQFCTIVNISSSYTYERILILSGYDLRSLCSALEDILSQSHEILGVGLSVNWLLHESHVDYLTSHDIERLNNILEVSSTLIDVYVLNCPLSSERIIRVRGQPSNISQCIYNLHTLLKWSPVKKTPQPYDADNAQETLASDYGGFNRDTIQNHATFYQKTSGKEKDKNCPDSWEKFEKEVSYLEQIRQVRMSIQSNQFPLSFPKVQRAELENINTTCREYLLPLHLLPIIMGNRGSRIEQICEESNADIEVKVDENKPNCCVVINGALEEVENARYLMKLCIQMLGKRIG